MTCEMGTTVRVFITGKGIACDISKGKKWKK
jgi:hypothetical protein